MKRGDTLRILDANLNRSREGLRVCEEMARFVLGDKGLTRRLKNLRHEITQILKSLPVPAYELLRFRDVRHDIGRFTTKKETLRQDFSEIFFANIERVKESLRVLEEVSKLLDASISARFKKTRFEAYAIEKKVLPKLEALCDHGPQSVEGKTPRRSGAKGLARRCQRHPTS